jgi:4,5-dihydroxyphthalate decarboxylase
MSRKIPITLACGDYEIVRALKEGTVQPEGIDLTVLTNLDSVTRHWRFFNNRELDMCEVSSCLHVMGHAQNLPFKALPVFLHRRFRHGFIFINTSKGITKPSDLVGRKVGCKIFLVSGIQWQRAILEHEYGVRADSMEWLTDLDEDLPFTPPPGLRVSRIPADKSIERMLVDGEIDALFHPDLIQPLRDKDPRVGRLFPDYKADEIAYYKKTEIFPIMHVMGIKQEIVEQYPWIPINMYQAFEDSKAIAMKRMENPRIVPQAWYRTNWEEEEEILGSDPWEYGLSDRNRHNLQTYVDSFVEQGLLEKAPALEELFLNVSMGRKRGMFRF